MNKWIKFPLIFGIIFVILGSVFHPINIWRKIFPAQQTDITNLISIVSFTGIIDGLIIGIIIGIIIALVIKKRKS